MTQEKRPVSQYFMWQELRSLRFGTFFFQVPFFYEKNSFKNLLNTKKRILCSVRPNNVYSLTHSFLSLLCSFLVSQGSSFYKLITLGSERPMLCSTTYHKITNKHFKNKLFRVQLSRDGTNEKQWIRL